MSEETKKSKTPDWKVVTKRGNKLGSQIGVGFNHTHGSGLTLLMDAQPIPGQDGQIELVVFPIEPTI